jgi:hypothetical protein
MLPNGAETWAWIKADISRVAAAEMRSVRNTEGKTKGRK